MTIEHAHAHSLPKPWGVVDLRPWSNAGDDENTIGVFDITTGDIIFAQSDHVKLRAERDGLAALVAYTGRVLPRLLQRVDMETTQ
jgi:hypothetical protein